MTEQSLSSGPNSTFQNALPNCVYCDTSMRIFLLDHTLDSNPMSVFRCDGCGWEAMVPGEPQGAYVKSV
jgi:hypothetical protein